MISKIAVDLENLFLHGRPTTGFQTFLGTAPNRSCFPSETSILRTWKEGCLEALRSPCHCRIETDPKISQELGNALNIISRFAP